MKGQIVSAVVLSSLSIAAQAGTMGPTVVSTVNPFISAEGGYTWNQIEGLNVNIIGLGNFHSRQSDEGGTGRLAAGVLRQINDLFLVSGEIGYGYYGETTLRPSRALANYGTSHYFRSSQDGFDALAGIIYNQPNFDVFFKAGAMIQNSRIKFRARCNDVMEPCLDSLRINTNKTQSLPEIKVGGSYHLWENLSILASWTHAFGSNTRINATINTFDPNGFESLNVNLQNPTLDVAMMGVQYQFN